MTISQTSAGWGVGVLRRKASTIGQNMLCRAAILERGHLSREKEVREGILVICGGCGSREKPRSGAKAQGGNVRVMFRNQKETSMPGGGGWLVSWNSSPRKPDHRLYRTVRTWSFTQSDLGCHWRIIHRSILRRG